MTSPIDSSTVGLLSLALDAAAMRQKALANNIANTHTPGHQRMGVSFETQLDALKSAAGAVRPPSLAELAQLQPRFEAADGPATLDVEVAQLSENALHHQALLKAVSKHYALISVAINEGKR